MTIYIYFFVKDDKQRRKRKATERKNYKRGKEEHLNQNRAKTRRETLLYRIRVRANHQIRVFSFPLCSSNSDGTASNFLRSIAERIS